MSLTPPCRVTTIHHNFNQQLLPSAFTFQRKPHLLLALPSMTRRLTPPPKIRSNNHALITPTHQVQLIPILLTRVITQTNVQCRANARTRLAVVAGSIGRGAVCLSELFGCPWGFYTTISIPSWSYIEMGVYSWTQLMAMRTDEQYV